MGMQIVWKNGTGAEGNPVAWFGEAEFRIEPCRGTSMHPAWTWQANVGNGFSIHFGSTPWEALGRALFYALRACEEGLRD